MKKFQIMLKQKQKVINQLLEEQSNNNSRYPEGYSREFGDGVEEENDLLKRKLTQAVYDLDIAIRERNKYRDLCSEYTNHSSHYQPKFNGNSFETDINNRFKTEYQKNISRKNDYCELNDQSEYCNEQKDKIKQTHTSKIPLYAETPKSPYQRTLKSIITKTNINTLNVSNQKINETQSETLKNPKPRSVKTGTNISKTLDLETRKQELRSKGVRNWNEKD